MKQSVSFFVVGLAVGAVLATGAFSLYLRSAGEDGGGAAKTVLKLGHSLDQQHPVHIGMEFMAKRLAEISGDTVEMQIFPNGQLGTETECLEQVQRGALSMMKISAAPMEGFVPEMAVFGVPYVFRDRDHMWKVLDGEIGKELLLKPESKGIVGICYYDAGSRSFYTTERPVLTPEDLTGQKIRTMRSKTAMDMIQVMGGAPTPIPFGELYTALQQGMVDGAENNPPSFFTNRHFEVAKHFSLDEHQMLPDVLLASSLAWQKLPEQVRQWVREAAFESSVFQREIWEKKSQEALAESEKVGVTIYHPEKEPFMKAVEPLHRSLEGTPVGDLIVRIREVQ
jgi:tripartite ATP-independent transporter DctP family solute receptor